MASNAPLPEWIREFSMKHDAGEESIKDFFVKFTDHYDETMAAAGYSTPVSVSKAFHTTATKIYGAENARKIRILDIAAGSGLVGESLKELGYDNIDAIDCSLEMLQKAKEKNLYKKFIVSYINERKNEYIKDGEYDAMISCGGISPPLIQASAFDEMVRWLKKDGVFCFTVRSLEDPVAGFKQKFQQLENEMKWKLVSREVVDYITNSGEVTKETVFQKAFIFLYQRL